MNSKELREKFINFFKDRGHAVIPSASLIPENDPTVLFTTAGMHPLVPYLLGEKHPAGRRLTSIQKCIRTSDIDEVGDNWHLTFFEMLGNWSLGDYFKKEAIQMSFEFLTRELNISPEKLAVTCFIGDDSAPKDTEAYEIWRSVGISEKRIKFLGRKDNWWGPAGQTGPCGPDSEMFYWSSDQKPPQDFDPNDKNWVEIWNDVFMQYNKNIKAGKRKEYERLYFENKSIPDIFYEYIQLEQKNVDTGMGLERTLAILNGFTSVYELDTLKPLIKKIEKFSGKKCEDSEEVKHAMRIIADHIRAAVFIISDGVHPSNLGQGYVLRRLIRRAARYVNFLKISDSKIYLDLIIEMGDIYKNWYPNLLKNTGNIVMAEVKKFGQTLEKGLKEFEKRYKIIVGFDGENMEKKKEETKWVLPGYVAFNLFASYGFPIELTKEIASDRGMIVDIEGFGKEFAKHQELSRTATAGKFKGGLADTSDQTKKLHTAAHLMLATLRQVLGDHIFQKGSNITPERLRFDFSHPEKLTDEQKQQIETIINQKIKENLPVSFEEMTLDQAKKIGAMGVFEHKYGDKVKVYTIGDFSKEICGGPHVDNIGELGHFKIIKEEASSAGIRRIKAVLEH